MCRYLLVILIVTFSIKSFAFRLPASVESTSKVKTSIGVDESVFLNNLEGEQVILRIENGEIDLHLPMSNTSFLLGNKKINLKKGMKFLSNNRIKVIINDDEKNLRKMVRDHIVEQTSYLNGILKSKKLSKSLGVKRGYAGVLGENHVVGGIYIKKIYKKKITFGYGYYYTKALFSTSVLKDISPISGKQELLVKVPLPSSNNKKVIYNKSCTDKDYNSFGDYWYFFNPYKKKCSRWLKKGRRVVEVDMVLRKPRHYENSTVYYPEFKKLYEDGEINLLMIVGFSHYMDWSDSKGEINRESIEKKLARIEKI